MQTVYCEHFGDEPYLEEVDATFTLDSKGTTVTLTKENYDGEDDAVTDYLDQYGRTPVRLFHCTYCSQVPDKSPVVGFLVDVENTESPVDFIRLRFEDDEFVWDKSEYGLPEGDSEDNLFTVTGYV